MGEEKRGQPSVLLMRHLNHRLTFWVRIVQFRGFAAGFDDALHHSMRGQEVDRLGVLLFKLAQELHGDAMEGDG